MEQRFKRMPPGYRQYDCCETCRVFDGDCQYYEYPQVSEQADKMVCDDYRPDN